MEEEIQFKPDEKMKICNFPGCGRIIEKGRYCNVCRNKAAAKKNSFTSQRLKNRKTYPKWKCPNCSQVYQLDFDIKFYKLRFNDFLKDHKCG